jgi:N-alpha-acetyl-L-2,4-diaminobutyrate deacetylase
MPKTKGKPMRDSPVSNGIDYERDGVQHGHLSLPHSRDNSAWGSLMVPITVVRNGAGPTVVLTGANHGDEYEGPIALYDLAANLDPARVSGRVIILPAMNYPAFRVSRRTSPIDGGNMNRVFPGRPDGSLTEKVADYIQRTLIPMADVVLDYHSGGRTLDFVPFACSHELSDKKLEATCAKARDAFNAPWTLTLLELDSVGMYDSAVEDAGKVFVSTEIGGGGTSTAQSVAIAKKGVRNLLIHSGVLAGEPELGPTTVLDMPDGDCFVPCELAGLA